VITAIPVAALAATLDRDDPKCGPIASSLQRAAELFPLPRRELFDNAQFLVCGTPEPDGRAGLWAQVRTARWQ
jgi:hypothetical protein